MLAVQYLVSLYALIFIRPIATQVRLDPQRIVGPPKLVLNSNEAPVVFYCYGRSANNSEANQLEASIHTQVTSSPAFRLETQIVNDTTIRVIVVPNGYVGMNRIICHWKNKVASGHRVDLIIGELPGLIQKKERCRAYDRQYVECIFRAPTIARAFRNGFPHLYQFSQLNREPSVYNTPPNLTNITDDNELVFRFQPGDRDALSTAIPMQVNMTLYHFGSSQYKFNIQPLHTTKVDFQIEKQSPKRLMILINHTNPTTMPQRSCFGHVSQVDDQKRQTAVQDIDKTSEQKILISRLRPSTSYEICLRCYYDKSDHSETEVTCRTMKTDTETSKAFLAALVAFSVSILIVIVVLGFRLRKHLPKQRNRFKKPQKTINITVPGDPDPSPSTSPSSSLLVDHEPGEASDRTQISSFQRYTSDPPSKNGTEPLEETSLIADDPIYRSVGNIHSIFGDEQRITPDTVDLTKPMPTNHI